MKKALVRSLMTLLVLSFALVLVSASETKKQELEEGQAVVTLKIEGMTCGGCCTKVETAVMELEGVVNAKADYKAGSATITYHTDEVSVETIIATINEKTSFKAKA